MVEITTPPEARQIFTLVIFHRPDVWVESAAREAEQTSRDTAINIANAARYADLVMCQSLEAGHSPKTIT